jgi:molecular chaperone DnaK (HSP70)
VSQKSSKSIVLIYKKISRKANIEDACGKQLSAKKVFSMVIKFLKDDLLKECSKQLGDSVNDKDVKWVLTVPAIWNDVAKQFMREAAIEVSYLIWCFSFVMINCVFMYEI